MVIGLVMHGIPQGVVVVAAIIPYADGYMSASAAHMQRTTNACMQSGYGAGHVCRRLLMMARSLAGVPVLAKKVSYRKSCMG